MSQNVVVVEILMLEWSKSVWVALVQFPCRDIRSNFNFLCRNDVRIIISPAVNWKLYPGARQWYSAVRALKQKWVCSSDESKVAIAERLNEGIRRLDGRFLLRIGLRWRELTVQEATERTLAAFQEASSLGPDEAALTVHVRVLVCFVLSAFPGHDGLLMEPLDVYAVFGGTTIDGATPTDFSSDVVVDDDDDDDDDDIDMAGMFGSS